MTDNDIIRWATDALNTPYGIKLETNSPSSFRQRFYQARKRLQSYGDHSIDGVSIRISPDNPKELWLINGKAADEARANPPL